MHLVKAITDPLKRDFGIVSEEQKKVVEKILREFMMKIGALVDHVDCRHACSSCGLSPKANMSPEEFLPTAYGLVWAISNDKLFVCHGNQHQHWGRGKNVIDTHRLKLCANLDSIMESHGMQILALADKTMSEIRAALVP